MKENISRRTALTLAAAGGLVLSAGAEARPAKVPVIWDGKKMWETFEEKAVGFAYPGPEGRPKAWVAFDPQCPDCMKFAETVRPFYPRIAVVWCPIAFLNIHSEPQGAAILAAPEPWKLFDQQHEHFRDAEFRGIRYDTAKIPVKCREQVWVNTKLHRRCGCRAVPFGVFRNAKGEYVPLDENLTREELETVFGVKP